MNPVKFLDHNGRPLMLSDTSYQSASRTARDLKNWNPGLNSADADLLDELDTLVSRSRDLTRNNGLASGYPQTLVDNVVGTQLRLSVKPDYFALGFDKEWAIEWAKNVESKWRSWANTTECDVTRQLNFGGMTQLIFKTGIVNGEGLAVPMWFTDRQYSTTIMLVDPDRLSNPNYQNDTDRLRAGIQTNRFGEPTYFHIQSGHPSDILGSFSHAKKWQKIPARGKLGRRRVLHLHDKERTGQSRGKPMGTAVLGDFKLAGKYQRYELQTAIANSMISAFIESSMTNAELSEYFGGDVHSYDADRNAWEGSMESGGAMIPLALGDRVTPFTPSRPASAFGEFMDSIHGNIAAGLNIPPMLLTKDFSKSNYSSARAAMLEGWKFFNGRKSWLINYWAQPVYELFLEEIINKGEVEAPDFYQNKAAYSAANWIGAAKGHIDPVKEPMGAKLRMDSGLSTQEKECAEQGLDVDEVQEQRVTELKRAFERVQSAGLPDEMAYVVAGFSPMNQHMINAVIGQQNND